MRKFLDTPFRLLILSLIYTTYGNIKGEMSIKPAADVMIAVQKLFRSGCLYVLQTEEETILGEKENLFLGKLLAELNVQYAILHHRTCNYSVQCSYNRAIYVIFYSSDQSLQQIAARRNSTNARWLLFLPEFHSLEGAFSQVYIPINCEFLVAQKERDVIQLSEVYRVNATFPLEVNRVGNWSHAGGLQYTNIPLNKRRSNLRGLVFRATISTTDPGTIVRPLGDNKYLVEGFLGKLWSILSERLNFSTQFMPPIKQWGVEVNGKWDGMIGIITSNEADVAVAAFSMSQYRLPILDYLTPLVLETAGVYIRKPEVFWPNWTTFFSPLKPELWVCVAVALLFLSAGLVITSFLRYRYAKIDACRYTATDSIMCVFGSLCGQGQASTPKYWSCRIVHLTSYLVGVVLLAAYSAALISFLAVKRTVLPFQTLEQLISDSSYKLNLAPGDMLTYFRNASSDFTRKVYTNIIAPMEKSLPDPLEGLRKLCSDPQDAFITSTYVVNAMEERKELACRIMPVPQTYFADTLCYIVPKGSPYRDILNYNIGVMKYNGELQRIRELHWYKKVHEPEERTFEVNMRTVSPVFIILVIGVLVATLLLIYERGRKVTLNKWKRYAYGKLKPESIVHLSAELRSGL